MENDNVVSGMVRKRQEIAGKIEDAQLVLRQLIIDLDNLDCAIRLFRPDIDLEEIRPSPLPPRHSAFKGEMSRIILAALRNAGRPMHSQEITHFVMAERGLNVSDKRLVRTIQKRIGACLKHYRNRGVLEGTKGPGSFILWRVK
ncbi:hypothetical protein [Dongia sp.]|uniref:hypothetical protein n=1 Tax=Dongia sp. TaxID=1977262 RepID=UPI00375187D7